MYVTRASPFLRPSTRFLWPVNTLYASRKSYEDDRLPSTMVGTFVIRQLGPVRMKLSLKSQNLVRELVAFGRKPGGIGECFFFFLFLGPSIGCFGGVYILNVLYWLSFHLLNRPMEAVGLAASIIALLGVAKKLSDVVGNSWVSIESYSSF